MMHDDYLSHPLVFSVVQTSISNFAFWFKESLDADKTPFPQLYIHAELMTCPPHLIPAKR